MMKKFLGRSLFFLVFVGIVYGMVFTAFHINHRIVKKQNFSQKESLSRAHIRRLNSLMPKTYDFLFQDEVSKARLKMYKAYYEAVLNVFPNNDQAYAMLGFYFYQIGDLTQARINYEKAHALVPNFFWNSYNLVSVYLDLNEYTKAAAMLQSSLKIEPGESIQKIMSSRIYQQIIVDQKLSSQDLTQHLKMGYADLIKSVQLAQKGVSFQQIKQNGLVKLTPQIL